MGISELIKKLKTKEVLKFYQNAFLRTLKFIFLFEKYRSLNKNFIASFKFKIKTL